MPPEKLLGFKRMKTKEQWLISEQWHEIGNNDILELIARVQQDALASRAPSPELVELRKDKERLDWLQYRRCGIDFFIMDDQNGEPTRDQFQVEGMGLHNSRDTLRAAIDAAKEK